MSAVARIGHVCLPDGRTVALLSKGLRSSVIDMCPTCRKVTTWIARADGAIAALVERKRR